MAASAAGLGRSGRSTTTTAHSSSSEPRRRARTLASGAAASLREGLEETLTVTRLSVRGQLKRTLASTNPCESMIQTVRRISRNVKRWRNGDMCLRWTATGMLEAQTQFRPIIGHTDLAKLALAVEREITAKRATDTHSERLDTSTATAAPEVAASPA